MSYYIDDPGKWRISKSGYSIKTGWSDEKKIIAQYAGAPNDYTAFQEWLDNAERICGLHNAAIDPVKEDMEWQPIETAPRDGKYILASDGAEDSCAVVRWDEGGWVYAWHEYDGPMFMPSATHWMPLPEPPK